jgi:hypothetical protein
MHSRCQHAYLRFVRLGRGLLRRCVSTLLLREQLLRVPSGSVDGRLLRSVRGGRRVAQRGVLRSLKRGHLRGKRSR